jgi:hypothetical protein
MSIRRRGRGVAVVAASVIAMVGLQVVRQPGARSWNTVWAEDERVAVPCGRLGDVSSPR